MKRVFFLLLAALALGCAASSSEHPSPPRVLWVVNGHFPGHPDAHALRIVGNRIAGFVKEAPPAGEPTVDAQGGLVLPGFYDAHVHLLMAGLVGQGARLGEAETLDAVLAAVDSFAHAHPDSPWIEGSGWAYSIVPRGTLPDRHQLDRAVSDRPAILYSFDGHTAWANSRALEVAGIDSRTADPPGGEIVREADGTPSGALLEHAAGLVAEHVPAPSRERMREALAQGARELSRLGVTAIDDIERDEVVLELLQELHAKDELPVRVRVGLPLEGDLARYAELRKKYGSPRLSFGFLKGFVDGVVESRTAFLLDPYAGSTSRGVPVIPRERLVALVSAAHAAGFPVALHSVGDGAVRLSLDAFEAAELAHPGPRPAHRIEHIEVLSPEDTPRFARLGVIASMQPFHAYPEPPTEVWSTNLGPGRLPRTFAWRDLLDAKATLIFGSDWPVASPNPLWGLAVATTRKDKDGQPPGGWNAREAITPAEALFAYTVAPQRAAGRDAVGTLDVGQVADLAVLSKGVSLDDAPSLWAGHVAVTIMDGVVRTAGASAPR